MKIFEKLDITNPLHIEAAGEVAGWSIERPSMKLYTPDEISQHPLGVLVFENGTELAGHVAVTQINEINGAGYGKIGGLAVAEFAQGNGLSGELIKHLLILGMKEFPEVDGYYAFVNQRSLGSFLANGAQIVGPREPSYPTGCNTIVSLPGPAGAGHE